MSFDEIIKRFTYHRVSDAAAIISMRNIRSMALDLAETIQDDVPEGRERSLAITKLEEVAMWANAGIARAMGEPE